VLLGLRVGIAAGVVSILTYLFFALAIGQKWVVPNVADDLTASSTILSEAGSFLIVLVTLMLVLSRSMRDSSEALVGVSRANRALEIKTGELERAEREMRAEAGKVQAILKGIADGVLVFDNEWRVTAANPALLNLAGRSLDDITGRTVEALMDAGGVPLDPEGWALVREALTGEQPTRFEWADKTLSASLSTVRDAAGEAAGFVTVLRDVTDEAELERARESLFAVTAHELRTPLNAIINYASLLHEDTLSPDQRQNASRRITANAEQLLILVNNLLERAKMEAGQSALEVVTFDPRSLVEESLDAMQVLAQEKGLSLACRVAGDVPAAVSTDRQRLYQVLINLIENAIKFTDQGAVEVRLTWPDAGHWAIQVSDTGPGIDREAQARIFDPFEVAGDPTTRKQAGAGLGLAIVKQITELLGGEIRLESGPGRGSTFTVTLPLGESVADGGP
jgi:PAS domain S-box-containing protein